MKRSNPNQGLSKPITESGGRDESPRQLILYIHKEITIMEANQRATATNVSPEKIMEQQSEVNVIETEITDDQVMLEEDVKFVGELGWLAAAAVTIASIAVSV
jgi:hypothetical protein